MPTQETIDLQIYTIVDGDNKGAWTFIEPPIGQSRCGGFYTHTHAKYFLEGFLRMLGMQGEKIIDWRDPRANTEYVNVPVRLYERAKKMYC